ncbi:alginate export family protein, partial [Sphingomonas bacterium]|uniref:alginate export family protein n=1 Tax=Sphingomonas bacterium TaxID=1895847 RepID=UPI0034A04CC2
VLALALPAGAARAQTSPPGPPAWSIGRAIGIDGLRVQGSSRIRYETITGQPRIGFNPADDLFNIRSTLLAEYRTGRVRIGGELWDSRVYGENARTPVSTGEVNALELIQAYVAADLPGVLGKGSTVNLLAGRILPNVGSRRLIAADDYRNTTNGYTGATATLAAGRIRSTLVWLMPQVRLPADLPSIRRNRVQADRADGDLVLWGGTILRERTIGPAGIDVSAYRLRERDAPDLPTRDRDLWTVSARLIRDPVPNGWDYEVEAIYQFGRERDGTTATAPLVDVSAWFVHAELARSLPGRWRPHLSLELDIASGDRPGGRYGRFDTLFGMRRGDFAPPALYGTTARANLATLGARLEVTPNARLDAFVNYQPLFLASRTDAFSTSGVRDPSGRSGRFAGHQLDSRIRYWLWPNTLRLEGDLVLLAKGRFLRDAPGVSSRRDTAYLSLNATVFF